ncbi:MAG: cytochrome c biogenesis protein [Deltaproteobacteria bacterium]|nr:cytochrome c biogenesis protein [Deltaproteobacteria bacterium]
MDLGLTLFRFATTFYLTGTVAYAVYLFFPKKWAYRTASLSLLAGFILHTGCFTSRIRTIGFPPITNLHDALSFMAWAIIGIYLIILIWYKIRIIGAFISPLALVLMLSAYSLPKDIAPIVVPYLKTFWLPAHIILVFFGNGFLAVAFAVAIMYMIQEYQLKSKKIGKLYRALPSLDILDNVNYKSLLWGFPLLTLGVISGAIVVQQMQGGLLLWGKREIWTLMIWLLYAVLLHGRIYSGWRGRKASTISIVSFIILLVTFFGINLTVGEGFRFH